MKAKIRKVFWKSVSVKKESNYYVVYLDKHLLKTPAQSLLKLPNRKIAKIMIALLVAINILVTLFVVTTYDLGTMDYFFYGSMTLLSIVVLLVFLAQSQRQYVRIHNLLKVLILLGVFSIVLLNPTLVLSKIL